jgi:hypothetical protein
MSIILLTVLVLLVGAVTYMLLKPLIRPVRVIGTCVLMVSLAAWPVNYVTFQRISKEDHNFLIEILQQQNEVAREGNPGPGELQNIGPPGIVGSGNAPDLKAELVLNTAEIKRSEPVRQRETVKRAELVTHNETVKRAELIRSRRQ